MSTTIVEYVVTVVKAIMDTQTSVVTNPSVIRYNIEMTDPLDISVNVSFVEMLSRLIRNVIKYCTRSKWFCSVDVVDLYPAYFPKAH
jgi:hypothetical protein